MFRGRFAFGRGVLSRCYVQNCFEKGLREGSSAVRSASHPVGAHLSTPMFLDMCTNPPTWCFDLDVSNILLVSLNGSSVRREIACRGIFEVSSSEAAWRP